jgi:uncharacterized repeat protein (TIGR01451 family)
VNRSVEITKEGSYMKWSLSAVVVLLVLASTVSSAKAQAPDLTGAMAAHKIVRGEGDREIAVPAEKVYPNDTVEYTLRYENTGSAAAAGVNLVGPIPAGTVYLDQTATEIEGLDPLFSIDGGKTYHRAPVTYVEIDEEGKEKRKVAPPDMYTHIRWEMSGTLDVGQEVTVSYRVQVK